MNSIVEYAEPDTSDRPDEIDTLVLSGRLDSLTSEQRVTAWVRGARLILTPDEMRQACKAQRRALRSTGTFTGNLCRVCGEVIPPTGKRGKPASVHEHCREQDKARKASQRQDMRQDMRQEASQLVSEVKTRLFGQ